MKLFQIEEPDGSPVDPAAPGAAIGIDASGAAAVVAVAVGGNAVILEDRDGFALDLSAPAPEAETEAWQALFEGARIRAERVLARPVTHTVIVAAAGTGSDRARMHEAAEAAGVAVLRLLQPAELPPGAAPALAAAILAEDLQPRSPAAPMSAR